MNNTREYLLHLNITIRGDRELSTTEVMNLLATMSTKLDDGTNIEVVYANHEEV